MPQASHLQGLFALFPPAEFLRAYEYVTPEQMPEPYRKLLVHEHHMTVTVEDHHGSLVDVRILDRKHEGDNYARKILLTLQSTGRVVQFGLVRIRFEFCTQVVRDTIIAGQTPLGRVLIENNVHRRIEPTAFLRVLPGPQMMQWFGMTEPQPTFGRLAIIHCDDQPVVEVLEIVTPE